MGSNDLDVTEMTSMTAWEIISMAKVMKVVTAMIVVIHVVMSVLMSMVMVTIGDDSNDLQ
jgi:hypothetical protein